MPKCHWLPFLVWCISGSRCPWSFLVELGAAIKVASTTVPVLSIRPRSINPALTVAQYLLSELVRFQQMPKAQDGAFVGQSCDASVEPGKLAVQRDVVQRFFHRRIGVTEELLQQVNAQHHFGGKRRASRLACRRMRRYQGQQLGPRNHQVHLIEELTLARALGDQLESGAGKAHLFHDSTVSDHAVMGLTFADHP
jgi:hypothetical protein